MDMKCSACGAPLTGKRCDYCRTKASSSSHTNYSIPEQRHTASPRREPSNGFPSNGNSSRLIALLGIATLITIAAFALVFFLPGSSTTNTDNGSDGDHALIGHWDNGSGRIFLFVFGRADSVEFREDGTVIITEGHSSQTATWESERPGHFTANNRAFTYQVHNDVLTITDSANDDWVFDRATEGRSTNRPVDTQTGNFADHALIGDWDNGSGRIFLFGLGDPDSVEFRVDGTVIITGGRSAGTRSWAPGTAGSFTIGDTSLTYRVSGDRLTIIDSVNDDWTFDRATNGAGGNRNESPSRNEIDQSSELVGQWDFFGTTWWTFEADGTGYQEGLGEFTWTSNNGVVTVTTFGIDFDYEYTINGNTLHLYGLDFPWDFEYRRR